jgi:peptide chain release factor 1
MLPLEKLEHLSRRYRDLDELLCRPDVLGDRNELAKLNKERGELEPLMGQFGRYREVTKKIAEDVEARNDPELRELVEMELPELEAEKTTLEKSIQLLLLPPDPIERKNTILEIRSGEGGEEAALFAADLFRMYTRFAETLGWKVEVLNISESATGGMKECIALVTGKDVYAQLRFEGGVHRVQRVPATETQGRIHTSTATVAVLPEADDVEVHIDEKDLEISIAASGGPGGQGVNTTNSAVQIQHKPSGLIVKCQDERSQLKNKAKAMKVLKSRLLDIEREKQDAAVSAERRGMVGTGERSQKIRTYNYAQNRVSDHRIRLTLNKLDRIIAGDLKELVTALRTHRQAALLQAASGEVVPGFTPDADGEGD